MIEAAAKLVNRVLGYELVFSLGVGVLVAGLAPRLLLMRGDVASAAGLMLLMAIACGSVVTLLLSRWTLGRHTAVLHALAQGAASIEPFELRALGEEPWRVTRSWLAPLVVALALAATLARPSFMDLTTSVSLGLLGAVIVAAASLPLHVVVRAAFLRAIELAPPEVMREVAETDERGGRSRQRIPRRLLAAVATPVAFVAIGSALIVNAHLRRADERQREETAGALAGSSFELGPGVVPGAGLDDAIAQAAMLGFEAHVSEHQAGKYRVERGEDGAVQLVMPLDRGTARVSFSGSTIGVLSGESLLLTLLSVAIAGLLGVVLGGALSKDLKNATRGVRLLGTDAVISGGTRVVRPARFRAVADLGRAIERLADRFRVFARAQERAINAREAAARTRGLLFASVSHDLKSPLNAILGFAELVRQREPLSPGQSESLEMIQQRGRELLAIIETILDAARVEAGQLTLVRELVNVSDLIRDAIDKGRDLGGDAPIEVVGEVAEGTRELAIDRVQLGRALATFIGHALRTADRSPVRVRAAPGGRSTLRIEVEVPSSGFTARQLEAMLNPTQQPGESAHRGLALGLALARSLVLLHGGRVRVADDSPRGARFLVTLPM
jgi:signal transduction histidine kinase